MATATLGSVSSGTMREEDLIPVFEDMLESLGVDLDTLDRPTKAIERMRESGPFSATLSPDELVELTYYLNETLFDALNEYAPDYCYFGSHEGDGADYGFWVSWDSIDDAVHDGEIDKGENTPEWPHDKPFLHVNDHGNATLYAADGTEIWSIV